MRNLAELFRPQHLDDFIGQKHLLSKNAPLRLIIESSKANTSFKLPHIALFGPPGSGKTSFANIIAKMNNQPFIHYNATDFKLDSLKKELSNYKHTLLKPLVFIDEIHRLNISQQEFFLPILEKYAINFIAASTENPFFSLSPALRSRLLLFEFRALSTSDLESLYEKIVSKYAPKHEFSHVKEWLLSREYGDCRHFLNMLDVALDMDSVAKVEIEMLEEIVKNSQGVRDKGVHYNYISALIKSIRGSDENAAIYYLSCLINAGENPEYIARRLVILASEDIGNANPNALNLSVSTMHAVSKIGYPEARIILAQCVIYLASSPKSNTAYKAINMAISDSKNRADDVPSHLLPHSDKYKYPHDYGGFVRQLYHNGREYVRKTHIGFEKTLQEWLEKIRNIR